MKAVVLEKQHEIRVREVDRDLHVGPGDLRIAPTQWGSAGPTSTTTRTVASVRARPAQAKCRTSRTGPWHRPEGQ